MTVLGEKQTRPFARHCTPQLADVPITPAPSGSFARKTGVRNPGAVETTECGWSTIMTKREGSQFLASLTSCPGIEASRLMTAMGTKQARLFCKPLHAATLPTVLARVRSIDRLAF